MDLDTILSSCPQVKEFPYMGIFDHDFRYTLITWSFDPPIHSVPKFISEQQSTNNSHITYIAVLPYNEEDLAIYIPTLGHIVLDHYKRTTQIIGSQEFHSSFQIRHRRPQHVGNIKQFPQNIPIPQTEKKHYIDGVTTILDEIREGNIYQCNLAWRTPRFNISNALETYILLRRTNPSRFGCWVKYGNKSYISNSPEQFLHVYHQNKKSFISSTPIKGTCSTDNPWNNKNALWNSKKEIAELTMVVDMVRNDLGRFCLPGTIISSNRGIRRCGDLYHAEQQVRGLFQNTSLQTILKATFPAASITGSPKKSAMKYISEIEEHPRNIYTGSIGWIKSSGETHLNVAIRTIEVEDHVGYFHVGCGIVFDSNPQKEWEESIAKSNAIMRTLGKNWI
jgi:anthranilate/para-aminobenzoate synthase component I